jgi:hypothetical protein
MLNNAGEDMSVFSVDDTYPPNEATARHPKLQDEI